jgi:hypothetical protein
MTGVQMVVWHGKCSTHCIKSIIKQTRVMKNIIVSLLCLVSISASAQDKKKKREHQMPTMIQSVGVSFQKFDGLKNRMATFPQYARLRDHVFTLSMGSMQNHNNFISQMNVNGGWLTSGDRDKKSSTLRTIGASMDLGYDVIPGDMLMVYPLAGVGVETYTAIFRKDNSVVNFNDVANSPAYQNDVRSVKFRNTFITYRLGLGIAVKSPKGHGTIGVQGGYTGSFNEKAWKSEENQDLNNAPVDRLHRWSVSLVFGGGGGMMHMMKKKGT